MSIASLVLLYIAFYPPFIISINGHPQDEPIYRELRHLSKSQMVHIASSITKICSDGHRTCKIKPINRGFSGAEIYKLSDVKGKTYLLKILTNFEDASARKKEIHLAVRLDGQGISPKIYQYSFKYEYFISEFIEGNNFIDTYHSSEIYTINLAKQIKKLHSVKLSEFLQYKDKDLPVLGLRELKCANNYCKQAVEKFNVVKEKLSDTRSALSHSDLYHDNILYMSSNILLIDWGLARIYSVYYDLATVVMMLENSHPEHVGIFLRAYFDNDPNQEQLEYLRLARIQNLLRDLDVQFMVYFFEHAVENKDIFIEQMFEKAANTDLTEFREGLRQVSWKEYWRFIEANRQKYIMHLIQKLDSLE